MYRCVLGWKGSWKTGWEGGGGFKEFFPHPAPSLSSPPCLPSALFVIGFSSSPPLPTWIPPPAIPSDCPS